MPETPDFDQALFCWDCGTPLVMHAYGAEKPCGHQGIMVLTRAEYLKRKGPPMAETTDFEQLARTLIEPLLDPYWNEVSGPIALAATANALRLVWNARGAADRAEVEATDATAEPLEDVLVALRSLDR